MLTVLPLRATWPTDERPDVAGYFPLAGAIVGAAAALMLAAARALGAGSEAGEPLHSILLAALVVLVWALLTRMLHWDALADVADAYWGAQDRKARLAIMSDPHTGAFGATAVTLVALVEVSALAVLIDEGEMVAVFIAATLARYGAVFGAWFGTAAKPAGLGAAVVGPPATGSATAAGFVLGLIGFAGWFGGPLVLGATIAGLVVALCLPHVLASRFGGVTGDVLGASVMLTEAASLVLLALVG